MLFEALHTYWGLLHRMVVHFVVCFSMFPFAPVADFTVRTMYCINRMHLVVYENICTGWLFPGDNEQRRGNRARLRETKKKRIGWLKGLYRKKRSQTEDDEGGNGMIDLLLFRGWSGGSACGVGL